MCGILELARQFVYAMVQVQFCRRSLQVELIEEPVNCPIVQIVDRPPRHGAKLKSSYQGRVRRRRGWADRCG